MGATPYTKSRAAKRNVLFRPDHVERSVVGFGPVGCMEIRRRCGALILISTACVPTEIRFAGKWISSILLFHLQWHRVIDSQNLPEVGVETRHVIGAVVCHQATQTAGMAIGFTLPASLPSADKSVSVCWLGSIAGGSLPIAVERGTTC